MYSLWFDRELNPILHQARRQSSVTGRGGAEKHLWSKDKFCGFYGKEDQKKSLSRSFTFFRATSLARGARLLLDGARRNLMERILFLARKFKGEDQKKEKKVFGEKSLAWFWRSLAFFVLERNFTYA